MSRVVAVLAVADGEIVNISHEVADLLGYKYTRKKTGCGVLMTGCGYDPGFDIVYNLSYKLFGDGCALRHKWI